MKRNEMKPQSKPHPKSCCHSYYTVQYLQWLVKCILTLELLVNAHSDYIRVRTRLAIASLCTSFPAHQEPGYEAKL